MFNWLRNAFCRNNLPVPAATLGELNSSPQRRLAEADRCSETKPATRAERPTRVVYARLSPELSQLAVAESVECQISRPAKLPAKRPAISRRRLERLKRFSRRFERMSLSEARLLVAVHRGSLRALAGENAGLLHRDLQRFLLSTHGQIAFNGKNAPGIEKIRRWVSEARQIHRARVIDPVP